VGGSGAKRKVMNLPNRDELWFRNVLALPKASNTGFVCTSRWSKPGGELLLAPLLLPVAACGWRWLPTAVR
jgi:hypothetical protein